MAVAEAKASCWDTRSKTLALLAYLLLSFLFFGRGLVRHFSHHYLGRDTDPSLYMWGLAWWLYVLRNHVRPFFTNLIWPPHGINLAWVTTMPLL